MPFFPIHHTFAPLGDRRQRMRAVKISYALTRLRRGRSTALLEQGLGKRLGGQAVTFSSGREALLAYLQVLSFPPGSEVIVPSFTCVVVPNAIRATGCQPVYVDIDRATLGLDPDAVAHACTPRTRAVICQHTFGIPAAVERIREICAQKKIILIEDCAHIIPDAAGPDAVGRTGDAVLLSFGRDKAISGVTGGAMLVRDETVAQKLRELQSGAKDLPLWRILAFLEYPQLYAIGRALYGTGLGRPFLWFMGKLGVLVPILSREERVGKMSATLHRMPNACAYLAIDQLEHLRTINDLRRARTTQYLAASAAHGWGVSHGIGGDLPLQKFPLFVPRAEHIRLALKRRNVHLHDGWTGCVICPSTSDAAASGYQMGSCVSSEQLSEQILTLPTHPGMSTAQAGFLVSALAELLSGS